MNNKQNIQSYAKIGMKICIVALFLICIVAATRAVAMYKYYQEHPINEWEYNIHEPMPAEAQYKAAMYSQLAHTISLGLGIFVLWLILEYLGHPGNSTLQLLLEWGQKLSNLLNKYLKDDEEELK